MPKRGRVVELLPHHDLRKSRTSDVVGHALGPRKSLSEVIGDGEGSEDQRPESCFSNHCAFGGPRWPGDPERHWPRYAGDCSSLGRLCEQMREKYRQQHSGGVGPRRVDVGLQRFVQVLGIVLAQVLLR